MNKKSKELKREKSVRRHQEFIDACARRNLFVEQFNDGKHLRAHGVKRIDYWPASGRWWVVGNKKSSDQAEELLRALDALVEQPFLSEIDRSHMTEIIRH